MAGQINPSIEWRIKRRGLGEGDVAGAPCWLVWPLISIIISEDVLGPWLGGSSPRPPRADPPQPRQCCVLLPHLLPLPCLSSSTSVSPPCVPRAFWSVTWLPDCSSLPRCLQRLVICTRLRPVYTSVFFILFFFIPAARGGSSKAWSCFLRNKEKKVIIPVHNGKKKCRKNYQQTAGLNYVWWPPVTSGKSICVCCRMEKMEDEFCPSVYGVCRPAQMEGENKTWKTD